MADNKEQKIYTISLKKAYASPRIYRARKAVKYLHDYLQRHLKDGFTIGPGLNQKIWSRGIKKPPTKVKVTVKKEEGKYRVELFGYVPKAKPKKPAKKKFTEKAKEKINEKRGKKLGKSKKKEKGPEKKSEEPAEPKEGKPAEKKPAKEEPKKQEERPEEKLAEEKESEGEKNGL
ncbi:MAG: 50S ribosomal protein L31e [archaeon]|nr:MAG: 50S ribosomal protein L31e [archaeon]